MRRIATGLLVLMAMVFIAARLAEARFPYLSYVAAFAEAAMVGALADWFAVTALFKRPFGLPIPHTAIIPANKDRIGASIANFLEHNFMTHNVITEELREVDFSGAASNWLNDPENSRILAQQAAATIPLMIHMVEDEDISRFIHARLASASSEIRYAPMLAKILTVLVADQRHQALFDRLIDIVADGLEKHKDLIRQKIHEKSPRWIPRSIDEKFFLRLLEELQIILTEMKSGDSEWRTRFHEASEAWIITLRSSVEVEEKISAAINSLLSHSQFRQYVDQVWADVKTRVLADIQAPQSRIVARLDHATRVFGQALAKDKAVRDKLNQWIAGFIVRTILAHKGVIAGLTQRVIQKWDGQTIAKKFELYVGKDLQYIRINGTLVGGMVGLLLHALSRAL